MTNMHFSVGHLRNLEDETDTPVFMKINQDGKAITIVCGTPHGGPIRILMQDGQECGAEHGVGGIHLDHLWKLFTTLEKDAKKEEAERN